MLGSKLISVLRTLSLREARLLVKFFHSPLFNESESCQALMDYVLRQAPAYDTPKLERKRVYKVVYGSGSYNDSKFRLLLTEALQGVQLFISIRKYLDHSAWNDLNLLEHFEQAGLESLFSSKLKDVARQLDQTVQDDACFSLHFQLEVLRYKFESKRGHEHNFQTLFHSLDSYYALQKLRYFCISMNQQHIFRTRPDASLQEDMLPLLHNGHLAGVPIIAAYRSAAALLLGGNDEAQFHLLKESIRSNSSLFNDDDLKLLSKIIENHCIRQINMGASQFYLELYELMQVRFRREVQIFAADFKNFVTLSLRLGKLKEVNHFISGNKMNIIPAGLRNDAYQFALARYRFYNREYEKVLPLLQQVEYSDAFYKIDGRKLLVQTYFEMQEWDALYSAMNAFRVFIHRNADVAEVHKRSNQNFINLLYSLLALGKGERARLDKLEKKVRHAESVAEREWLLQKIKERK